MLLRSTRVLHRLLNEVRWNNGNKITAPIQTQGKTGNYLFNVEPYTGGPQGHSVTTAGSKPIGIIELPLRHHPYHVRYDSLGNRTVEFLRQAAIQIAEVRFGIFR